MAPAATLSPATESMLITVEQIMTPRPDLVTITPDATVADAARMMATHNIRHLPVLGAGGELLGIVSDRDVLAATGPGPGDGVDRRLSEIMSTAVHKTAAAANVRGVALALRRHRIGCLPVMDDGRLVGIVTDTDFVGVAINLLEVIEDAEPEPVEP
jgi:CBS domain-containing protein